MEKEIKEEVLLQLLTKLVELAREVKELEEKVEKLQKKAQISIEGDDLE